MSRFHNQHGAIGTVGDLLILLLVCVTVIVWWVTREHNPPAPLPPLSQASPEASAPAPTVPSDIMPTEPPPLLVAPMPSAERHASSPTPMPVSVHAHSLQTIQQLLSQNRDAEAEMQLTALPQEVLTDSQFRPYVASLWNNLGVMRHQSRGPAAAMAAYRTALSLDQHNSAARLNLTKAYVQTKDTGLTREFLEQTIQAAPDDPLAHLALADLLHEKDDLAGATLHLDHAKQRIPPNSEQRPYLDLVVAKFARAEKAERNYSARESSHFTVKFNGSEDHDTWTTVLDILEDAYRDIGQKFNYFPSKPIIVVLHTKASFQGATGSPAWADGLYDPLLGRITIPTQGALTDHAWLTRVLRHEFVHALLHQRMDGGAIPQWLNEGLAMQLAGDTWPDLDRIMKQEITLIPLNRLEGNWSGFNDVAATIAYLEGNSAVSYLIDRYGIGKVQDIVTGLAAKQPMAAVLPDRLMISYDEFQRRWNEHINEKIRAGRT